MALDVRFELESTEPKEGSEETKIRVSVTHMNLGIAALSS
jgi:hypothetical protein